jgi:hypothetical protein
LGDVGERCAAWRGGGTRWPSEAGSLGAGDTKANRSLTASPMEAGLNLVAMDTRAKFPGWGPQEADVVRWFIYGFLGLVGLLVVAVATL